MVPANPALNVFNQSPIQGMLDLRFNGQTVSCIVDISSAGNLVPGQAVKMVGNVPGGVPHVVECAANSDDVYGFINYNIKNQNFSALDNVEISAMRNNVMYMTASAAILRNAQVAVVIASQKVVTATSGMRIIGRAFDEATAADQLIRVTIDLPGATA